MATGSQTVFKRSQDTKMTTVILHFILFYLQNFKICTFAKHQKVIALMLELK